MTETVLELSFGMYALTFMCAPRCNSWFSEMSSNSYNTEYLVSNSLKASIRPALWRAGSSENLQSEGLRWPLTFRPIAFASASPPGWDRECNNGYTSRRLYGL